jgi:rfaE bifunctional protein nucleotidyltransferase chain/domain
VRVFVNGTFDCLHIAHLRLLQFAKRQGDCLIVGLNSDESVRRSKGPSRPIIPEAERLEMLYGVGADEVIVFDEETPFELVKSIRPDVLVVSSQYGTDCESCRHVREYDGNVVQAPDCGDVSTSQIIERIMETQ